MRKNKNNWGVNWQIRGTAILAVFLTLLLVAGGAVYAGKGGTPGKPDRTPDTDEPPDGDNSCSDASCYTVSLQEEGFVGCTELGGGSTFTYDVTVTGAECNGISFWLLEFADCNASTEITDSDPVFDEEYLDLVNNCADPDPVTSKSGLKTEISHPGADPDGYTISYTIASTPTDDQTCLCPGAGTFFVKAGFCVHEVTSVVPVPCTCGDGYLTTPLGEECDDGGESVTCDADCTNASCGDGTTNATAGEDCDDSGESATCDANCTDVACGDGTTNTTAGEECDDSGESVSCDADCTNASCGDGTLNTTAGEQCDDGNTTSGDGCDATCQIEV